MGPRTGVDAATRKTRAQGMNFSVEKWMIGTGLGSWQVTWTDSRDADSMILRIICLRHWNAIIH